MPSDVTAIENESAALNSIRLRVPRDVAEALTDVLMERDERVRLRSIARFVELLAGRLCDLLNSEYFVRPVADPKLERRLRQLKEKRAKGLAFGDLASALDEFPKVLGREFVVPELEQVFNEYLPDTISAAIKAIDTLIEARRDFEIPVGRLESYVAMRLKGQSVGRNRVGSLLWKISSIRNAYSHPEGRPGNPGSELEAPTASQGNRWWVESPEFYALLNSYLAPAIRSWLLWPPMSLLLTRYEVVGVRSPVVEEGGRYRSDGQRYQIVPPFPPGNIVSKAKLDPGTQVVVRVHDSGDDLEAIMRVRTFPTGKEDRPRLTARYLGAFAQAFINDARIDDTERAALLTRRTESDLSDNEAQEIEEKVIQRWLIACRAEDGLGRASVIPRADESRPHLLSWLCSDGEVPSPEARTEASAVLRLLSESVIGIIRDDGVMSFSGLKAAAGLPAVATSFVLDKLIAEQKLARVGRDDALDAMYQHRDPTDWNEFVAVLTAIRAERERGAVLPGFLGRLLKLTREMLVDAGHQSDPKVDDEYNLLLSQVSESAGGEISAGKGSTEEAESGSEPLRVEVGGDIVEDTGVAGLVRRVVDIVRNDPRFLAAINPSMSDIVPFDAGRLRYLVALTPEHKNGAAFRYPIEVDVGGTILHFEGNFPREVAQFHIQRFLDACEVGSTQAAEARVKDAAERIVATPLEEVESESEGSDSPSDSDSDLPGVTAMSGDTAVLNARGETVPRFLETFLRVLTKDGLVDRIDLPFPMGRVRYFIAEAPFHRDGRRFLRQVEWDGVYAEASMPWDLALEQASRVCGKLNLSVTATQPSGWSSSTDLAVRLDTGVLIDGEDVRTFARRLMDVFRDDGTLDDVVGWKTGGVRYLVWSEPTHQAGHAFKSPLEYVVGDKSYFFECHASRQNTMNYVLRLLKEKGYKVVAVGEAARSWTDSVDVAVESHASEVAPEAVVTQVEPG